ncbi:streptophobe family protein [Streptomyces nogalater]
MLWARCGGALAITAVALPVCAGLARGTVRLPENVKDRIAERVGSGRFGGGAGGGLASGLSSVDFRTDVVTTAFLGWLGVVAVLAVGCLAARRTTLPRPVALGGPRLKWHAVLSALTGSAAVLCCVALAVAVLAGAAALTGRERAAEAAGALLLAGPNLIAALLTTGAGTSWEAGCGGRGPRAAGWPACSARGSGTERRTGTVWWTSDTGPAAGVPLWVIGLLLTLLLLLLAGYVAAARTPARTAREDADSFLDRHTDTALRMGIAVGAATFVLPYLARGSLRIGVSLMGSEMGGLRVGLDTSPRLSALTAFVAAALAGYGGSRLQGRRARRREGPAGSSGTTSRRRSSRRTRPLRPCDLLRRTFEQRPREAAPWHPGKAANHDHGGTDTSPRTAGRPDHLLVVDDEPTVRELLRTALRYAGFDVDAAATGREALDLAARHAPDLVLLDVMLPDMDGFEVIRRLRAQPARPCPAGAATCRSSSSPHARTGRTGCTDCASAATTTSPSPSTWRS